MTQTRRTADRATETTETAEGFTPEERAAMKERARELRGTAKRGGRAAKVDPEAEVLAKIAEMPGAERAMAERIHAVVRATAPELTPRLWYGMPAYAKDGKVVCFFQNAQKFKSRYSTLGFNDDARLDDGVMWPTSYALTELTPDAEVRIAELVRRAVS
jgi:uncharacterized protein YdhG (YjbR/CyaY superfamily)